MGEREREIVSYNKKREGGKNAKWQRVSKKEKKKKKRRK